MGDEEVVDQRNEAAARDARDHRAEYRHHGEHHEKSGGEQPGQVAHAAGDAHLVAHRAQHVIGRKQEKEIGEGPQQGPYLGWLDGDDPRQPMWLDCGVHEARTLAGRAPGAGLPSIEFIAETCR